MGKSDKKIRADSINNLRKRYDAFLEEDRKRKERNEDILTKLDKMRNSVTRFKSNIYLDPRLPTNIYGDAEKSPVRRYNEPQISTELDIRRKHVDETRFLSEISKKYILIPKLRSIDGNDYVPRTIQQDNNNDNDWKSKYNILDQLKQSEKEETTPAFNDSKFKNHNVSRGLPKYQEDDEPVKLLVKRDTEDMKSEHLGNEFTSTQQSHPQINMTATFNDFAVDSHKNIHEETQKQPIDESAITKTQEPNILKGKMVPTEVNDCVEFVERDQQQLKSEASFVVREAPVQNYRAAEAQEHVEYTVDQRNHYGETTDKHETENTEKSYPGDEKISHATVFHPEQSYPDYKDTSQAAALHPQKSYPGDDDITHVEVLHPDELVQEIANENVTIGGAQENNYPIDIINVQEFTPGNDVNLVEGVNFNPEGHNVEQYIPPNHEYVPETITAADQEKDVTYQDPVYTDEQGTNEANYDPSQQYESTGNLDNTDVTSGIQEFETEQNEMYYSESNAQNYDQYNQGDVYNTGYTGPMEGFDPSAYYEGTQQEGAYPMEINEHEETSQRYDPNYEQQYATTDPEQNQYLPQQNETEQPQGQQENLDVLETAGDAKTPEYDQGQYDTEQQETTEHLEQQLDLEDGYVDQNIAGNIRDITDEAILYQQAAPDQTLEQSLENLSIPAVET